MNNPWVRIAMAASIVCVVLAPALIWSGQRPQPANEAPGEDLGVFKEPPFFTVGPPMTPEELAAREMEKHLSLLEGQAWFGEYGAAIGQPGSGPSDVRPETVSPNATDHSGLTPAELEKLAAIRSGALQPRVDRGTWGPKPVLQAEKLDAPLRPLGAEGLTPEEKTKLEAFRARQQQAGRDEGGRSR